MPGKPGPSCHWQWCGSSPSNERELLVKNPPANAGDPGLILDREDPLEKGMATHSRILVLRTPWTEELVGYSPWGRTESDTTEQT